MVSVNEVSYGDLIMRLYAAHTENELSALTPELDAALAEFALAAKQAGWLKEAYALRAEEFGVGHDCVRGDDCVRAILGA